MSLQAHDVIGKWKFFLSIYIYLEIVKNSTMVLPTGLWSCFLQCVCRQLLLCALGLHLEHCMTVQLNLVKSLFKSSTAYFLLRCCYWLLKFST